MWTRFAATAWSSPFSRRRASRCGLGRTCRGRSCSKAPRSRPRMLAGRGMHRHQSVVFLFDVDNTLLDNDRVAADLKRHLETEVGHERQQRYWAFFEEWRAELGYADYLGALQRYRSDYPRDPHLLTVADCLVAELSARGYQHQPNWGTRGLRLAGLACSC